MKLYTTQAVTTFTVLSQLEGKIALQTRKLPLEPIERVFRAKTCAGVHVIVKPLLASGRVIIRGPHARVNLRES